MLFGVDAMRNVFIWLYKVAVTRLEVGTVTLLICHHAETSDDGYQTGRAEINFTR
jgi:hypothetical protein